MKAEFRVALVGCGAISGNHLGGILAAGQTVCALCDLVLEKAQKKAVEFGLDGVAIYTDYTEMLRVEKPDIVHICTPHYLHAPMIVEALAQNVNVLCEKPLCISMEQLGDIRRAVSQSEARLGVCHQNRWKPSMRVLKQMAEGGIKGAFGSVVWDRGEAYYRSDAWRGSWEQEGGGVMINQALHTLDLLQWMCGMPTHVTAQIDNWHLKNVIEVEDTASARFESASGMPINFYATTGAGASLPITVQMVLADKCKVTAQNDFLLLNGQLHPMHTDEKAPIGKEVWGSEHAALIADFYRSIEQQIPFAVDCEEAGKVIRLILAMYASNGKRIPIEE